MTNRRILSNNMDKDFDMNNSTYKSSYFLAKKIQNNAIKNKNTNKKKQDNNKIHSKVNNKKTMKKNTNTQPFENTLDIKSNIKKKQKSENLPIAIKHDPNIINNKNSLPIASRSNNIPKQQKNTVAPKYTEMVLPVKRVAICFTGISYMVNMIHFSGSFTYSVDYNESVNNYREYIFNYFINRGYHIDVFISSYDNEKKNQIIETYKPVKSIFVPYIDGNTDGKRIHTLNVINIVKKYSLSNNVKYDNVLITRFDLLFKKKFSEMKVDFKKFNLMSELKEIDSSGIRCVDDNVFLFPYKMLNSFKNIVESKINPHRIRVQLNKKFGSTSINFMWNETVNYKSVPDLESFKINRINVKNKKNNSI